MIRKIFAIFMMMQASAGLALAVRGENAALGVCSIIVGVFYFIVWSSWEQV